MRAGMFFLLAQLQAKCVRPVSCRHTQVPTKKIHKTAVNWSYVLEQMEFQLTIFIWYFTCSYQSKDAANKTHEITLKEDNPKLIHSMKLLIHSMKLLLDHFY